MKIFLGFNFYGAGNIGDDLMLAGFLDAISEFALPYDSISCAIPYSLESQNLRFPQINWHNEEEISRSKLIEDCDVWMGVGDTPFQLTSGHWFLEYLKKEMKTCQKKNKSVIMASVGAEAEAGEKNKQFNDIVKKIKFITTRDKASAEIIKNTFDSPADKILFSADLANISLQNLFYEYKPAQKTYDLGFTVNADTLNEHDILTVKKFIDGLNGSRKIFLFNEVRPENIFERSVYKKYFKPWYKPWHTSNLEKFSPNYQKDPLRDLISAYGKCNRLISTRYHGLLTGAWARCKVGAIARSSKVENLAKLLGVPYVKKPFDLSDLENLYENLVIVPQKKLDRLADQAREGIKFLWQEQLSKVS